MSDSLRELRLLTRLDRSTIVALGAVLSAAGIVLGCHEPPVAIYGGPPIPPPPPSAEVPTVTEPSPSTTAPAPSAPPAAPASASAAPAEPIGKAKPKSPTPGAPVAAYGAPPAFREPSLQPPSKEKP